MNALAYFGFPSNSLFRQHMAPAMEMFTSYKFSRIVLFSFVSFVVFQSVILEKSNKKSSDDANEKWKKKDIRDYTEADLERLYDQWEDAEDEPLEEDELPEWKRPQPKIDLSQLNPNDPEGMLKMSKQGRTLMMFASVSGNPTEKETETITQLWQSSLFNAHYDVQRYVVGSNRALFLLKDGAKAWEVKDFLIKQDRCEVVTIEGKDYPGRGSQGSEVKDDADDNKSSKKPSKSKKDKTNDKKSKSRSSDAGQKDSQATTRDDQPREDL